MKISTKGRYGLQAMEVLKDNYNKGPISVNDIAKEKGISEAYLEQLFSSLRRHGLVNSIRGAYGGYELAKSPEEISIGEILDALEGETDLANCQDPECSANSPCRMKNILDKIEDGFYEVADSIKLSEM